MIMWWSGCHAYADEAIFIHESFGRGDLALLIAGLRTGLAVNVGGGPIHALRMARDRRNWPLPPLPSNRQ